MTHQMTMKNSKVFGRFALLTSLIFLHIEGTSAADLHLYVSTIGDDGWSGRLSSASPEADDGPFATLQRAQNEIRQIRALQGLPIGGVTVWVREGNYELPEPLALQSQDSGTEDSPITYAAYEDEIVQLSGGRALINFERVSNNNELDRLDVSAHDSVRRAEIPMIDRSRLGAVSTVQCSWPCPSGGDRFELFFDEQPMVLSRWPNEGFVSIKGLVPRQPILVRSKVGDAIGDIYYEGNRPSRWINESSAWLHGYWYWDWADQRQPIASIDTEKKIIFSAPPYHRFGYSNGQRYYVFNVLAELDSPGEWYLDREDGVLYFWPPVPINGRSASYSLLSTVLTLDGVSNVTIDGFVFQETRGTAINIKDSNNINLTNCTVRNTGAWALEIDGGTQNRVVGCEIYQTGDGGISIRGGDRESLTPSGHGASYNHIHHYSRWTRTYQPAIALDGVGHHISNNLIHDAPHQAISISGNDHTIEYNEIHSVSKDSRDAGAIYGSRDWSMRGTIIRHNYLHDIYGLDGSGATSVYLDDMYSGTRVIGNIFKNVSRGILIGGGRDNEIINNIFIEADTAVHVDDRGKTWANTAVDGVLRERLETVPYASEAWRTRYPNLANIMQNEPAAPAGNKINRNISYGGEWLSISAGAERYIENRDNIFGVDPLFIDVEKENFGLQAESPAHIVGFEEISIELIGLIENRANQ